MSFRKWSDANVIEMYSTHNEGKAVVAEKFLGTLKHKFYKRTAAAPKNVSFGVLDDIVDKYNNTYWND